VLRNIHLGQDGDHGLANVAGAIAALCVLSSTDWAVEPAPSEGRAKILALLMDIMLRTANLQTSLSQPAAWTAVWGFDDILTQHAFQTVAKPMVHLACRAAILVTDASLPEVAMRQAMRAASGAHVFAVLFRMQYDGERPTKVPHVVDAADAVWYLWMAWKEMTTVECSEVLSRCPAAGPALVRSAFLSWRLYCSRVWPAPTFSLWMTQNHRHALCSLLRMKGMGRTGAGTGAGHSATRAPQKRI
jgi:hypothetical protein